MSVTLPDFEKWASNILEQNKYTPELLHESIQYSLTAAFQQGKDWQWWNDIDNDKDYIESVAVIEE